MKHTMKHTVKMSKGEKTVRMGIDCIFPATFYVANIDGIEYTVELMKRGYGRALGVTTLNESGRCIGIMVADCRGDEYQNSISAANIDDVARWIRDCPEEFLKAFSAADKCSCWGAFPTLYFSELAPSYRREIPLNWWKP